MAAFPLNLLRLELRVWVLISASDELSPLQELPEGFCLFQASTFSPQALPPSSVSLSVSVLNAVYPEPPLSLPVSFPPVYLFPSFPFPPTRASRTLPVQLAPTRFLSSQWA